MVAGCGTFCSTFCFDLQPVKKHSNGKNLVMSSKSSSPLISPRKNPYLGVALNSFRATDLGDEASYVSSIARTNKVAKMFSSGANLAGQHQKE